MGWPNVEAISATAKVCLTFCPQ